MHNLFQDRAKLPHALLLSGHPDAILQDLTPTLQGLLCESGQNQACGACHSCQLYQSEAGHPDLIITHPEGKLNIIKIDTVREVIGFLEQSAMRGGMRIVVFVQADTLNTAAQNALLKSLEEPGAKTLLILISSKAHLLLPTIKSRCQLVKLDDDQPTQNLKLAETLLGSFEPLSFVEAHKELDLLECIHIQMNLIHDCLSLQMGGLPLTFASLQAPLFEIAKRVQSQKLTQFYRDLAQKSKLFQKKVAVNQELCLFELALAWKRLIAQNTL